MGPAPYTGPEPTIVQLRTQFGWRWAYCGIDCHPGSAGWAQAAGTYIALLIAISAPLNAGRKTFNQKSARRCAFARPMLHRAAACVIFVGLYERNENCTCEQ